MTIYSCSMFCSELELLMIKLEMLDPVVDFFVISESNFTHSGKPKELVFKNNSNIFKKFEHKIIHQVILDTPSDYTNLKENPLRDPDYNLVVRKVNSQKNRHLNLEHYGRDCFEKESLIRALHFAKDDDVILLSDLDEIVKSEKLKSVLDNFNQNEIYYFYHDTYYYYLNLKSSEPSYGTIALSYKNFKEKSHSAMREDRQGIFIPDAGYHWTYLGNAYNVRNKIESFSHQELNTDDIKSNLGFKIKNAVSMGMDLYGRRQNFQILPITTEYFPEYLVNNRGLYDHLICKNLDKDSNMW